MVCLAKDNMKNMKFRGDSILPERHTLTPVATLDEVIEPILKAKTEKKILRVAGAQHSVNNAIFPDDGVTLLLTTDLRKVEILYVQKERRKKWLYCRIGGSFYLGKDPMDPNSNLKNSACYQVAVYGFGFPELGGIIQQSVCGLHIYWFCSWKFEA